jgi:hypothetical protein
VPLPTPEIGEVLELVVRLAVDPETVRGDGRQVNALSEALRRRLRRRLRKEIGDESVEALCGVDFERWRVELRALAAARAIEACDCSLRTALLSLARDQNEALDPEVREGANIAPRVAESPVAMALLRRIVGGWLAGIV